jgi:hypothetical protein
VINHAGVGAVMILMSTVCHAVADSTQQGMGTC